MSDFAARLADLGDAQRALLDLRLAQRGRGEPIAIVGMACRLPGAAGIDAFWRLLEEGGDAISEVPPDRWAAAELYDPDPRVPGRMNTRWGGFLPEVRGFDPEFFGISPREAARMDPQQRLLLEVATEALEDAGMPVERLAGSPTGVFVGIFMDDYRRLELRDRERLDGYVGTGSTFCIAANRISYLLDLRGPSMAIDTACSSSLVAVHLACQSLLSGETTLALAGGVNLLLTPEPTIEMTKAGLMSPDGRCKTFDARADGYVRSEGAGLVVLKRLSQARADGDPIYAVIRGGAVNQDGRTNGITSPNRFAQEEVLRAAYRRSGVAPEEVQYVEAHGTGTALGDAIECRALGEVLGAGRPPSRTLRIGSVKTNIGHLETAAGIAGLIKVALCLERGGLPPSLHCVHPNPDIPFAELRLQVQDRLEPWPRRDDRPRLAGLSSFGFGGTNAHLVLEEAPAAAAAEPAAPERPLHLLTLSARSPKALTDLAERYAERVAAARGEALADLCYSANVHRSAFEHRLAAVAATGEEMAGKLAGFARGEAFGLVTGRSHAPERPRLAFLFSGQGAQYPGMGSRLFDTQPVFRQTLLRCQDALAPLLDRPLLAILFPAPGDEALLDDTAYTQPALFALEVALAELWRSWGVEPDALLGHSVGEYAAACQAGVFTLEEGCALLARRARLMADLPRDGAMVAIFADEAEVGGEIEGRGGEVSIAAINGPANTVISGRRAAVEEIAGRFAARGVKIEPLKVSHAFHSALLDPLLAPLEAAASTLHYRAPRAPERLLISNRTGAPFAAGELDARYVRQHAREPVRFSAGMESLRREGCRLFVEIGPGTTLLGMGAKLWEEGDRQWLPSLRRGRDDWEQILRALSTLWTNGCAVDWRGFDAGSSRRRCKLPTYPFQRQPYWTPARNVANTFTPALEPGRRVASGEPPAPQLLRTADLPRHPDLAARLELLSEAHGVLAGSISQVTGKAFLFLASAGDALIYLNQAGSSLAAIDYTGPREGFVPLVRELAEVARRAGLELNIFGVPAWLDGLEPLGFAATRIGTWQDLDLPAFQLAGGAMRRLRYLAQKYAQSGRVETVEHEPGAEPEVDSEIGAVIDEWAAARNVSLPFAQNIRRIGLGSVRPWRHRLFLVRRDGRIDAALWLLPSPGLGDYLMDIEVYRAAIPAGCLELGISAIVEILRSEGATHLSLGFTPGAQMTGQEGDDPAVRALLARLHDNGVLNGDANFQFKSKFRPRIGPALLWRPRGADPEHLADLIQMLGQPFASGDGGDAAAALIAAATAAVPQRQVPAGESHLHPLVHRRLDLAVPSRIFESVLDLRSLSYLADHRLAETALLPAAGYVEMALACAAAVGVHNPALTALTELAELTIQDVQTLSRSRPVHLQIILHAAGADGARIEFWSRVEVEADGAHPWALRAAGRIAEPTSAPAAPLDLAGLRANYAEEISGAALYDSFRAAGYDYGASFQTVDRIWLGESAALGRIVAPPSLSLSGYRFHPALLDGCLHFAMPLLRRATGPERTVVPVGFKGLRVWRTAGRELWSQARLQPAGEDGLVRVAIRICDGDGGVVAECDELVCREASAEGLRLRLQGDAAPWLHGLEWRPMPASDPVPLPADGTWILCEDRGGVGAAIASRLAERGLPCRRVRPGGSFRRVQGESWEVDPGQSGDFARLVTEIAPEGPLRLLFLWGLDGDLRLQLGGLLALVQGLSASGRAGRSRVWIATSGAVPAGPTDPTDPTDPETGPLALPQATLWGFARVLAREHPELWGGIVDVRAAEPDLFAAVMLAEIARRDADRFVAHVADVADGGGRRYVPRLVRRSEAGDARLQAVAAGTHLITGGLGGLGLRVAARLVERGARHLALFGRSGPNAAAESALRELRQKGAEVHLARVDVADREQLAAALAELAVAMPPLVGVVHAAGVIDDDRLLRQSWERCERVLAPKVLGALHLHELTRGLDLRYFALFSSLSALVGTPGQVAYAAGNAFLDALAHERRRAGLPAVSIAWGPWAAVGMTAGQEGRQRDRWAAEGIGELGVEAGLAAFESALAPGPPQRVMASLAADRLAFSSFAGDPLLAELLHRGASSAPAPGVPAAGSAGSAASAASAGLVPVPVADELAALDEAERRRFMTGHLRERVAAVLHLDAAALDVDRRLNQLGMDSLTVMELRNALKASLRIDVPAVELFSYPSVQQLADLVLSRFLSAPPDLAPEAPPVALPQAAQVDQLSDEEVEAMLRQLLATEEA